MDTTHGRVLRAILAIITVMIVAAGFAGAADASPFCTTHPNAPRCRPTSTPTLSATNTATSTSAPPTATTTGATTASATNTPAPAPTIAVADNAGGSSYTAVDGTAYSADFNWSNGSPISTSTTIAGTSDQPLYQTARQGATSYAWNVPSGTYTVVVKFAEIGGAQPGQRVQTINILGRDVLTNFDIAATVGQNSALDNAFTVSVGGDGSLYVNLVAQTGQTLINAIEIVGGSPGSPTATPVTSNMPTATSTSTVAATATSSATAAATGTPTITPTVGAGKLRFRSVDVMKASKDVVNNQPSDATIATIAAAVKSMHTTHVAFSVPLDSNTDFQSFGNNPSPRTIENFTLAWTNAIHAAGLGVLFRGTLSEFEQGGTVPGCGTSGHTVVGLYNFPFYVAGDPANNACAGGLQPQSYWLNKIQGRLTTLAQLGAFRSGDIIAVLPEPQSNQNMWDTKWNWLGTNNDATGYANFFLATKQAEDAAMSVAGVSGVITGFTSDNGSMFLSAGAGGGSWVPASYEQTIGTLNVDHYGSDGCGGNPQFSPAEMLCGLQDMYSHYTTPIFHQEWSDIGGRGPAYVQSMLTNADGVEVANGQEHGYNYWDPGVCNPGSVFNCDYSLSQTGVVVGNWFAAN